MCFTGIGLNVYKSVAISFTTHLSRPWVGTLVSLVPSTIRTETGSSISGMNTIIHVSIVIMLGLGLTDNLESLILNIGGRAVMLQREYSNAQSVEGDNGYQVMKCSYNMYVISDHVQCLCCVA